eukprot:scaffold673559_cov67-Prasinocladus_malaysianus.AAC.1
MARLVSPLLGSRHRNSYEYEYEYKYTSISRLVAMSVRRTGSKPCSVLVRVLVLLAERRTT